MKGLKEMFWLTKEENENRQRIPRNGYRAFLVLDRSGSMSGRELRPNKLSAAKDASLGYLDELRQACPEAVLSVVSYDNQAKVECENLSASQDYSRIVRCVKRIKCRGATDIGFALRTVYKILRKDKTGQAIQLVLLSDGWHNGRIEPVGEAEKLKRNPSIRIDCVGIGRHPGNVDESLMKQIATTDEDGRPRYHFIKDSLELLMHFKRLAGFLAKQ